MIVRLQRIEKEATGPTLVSQFASTKSSMLNEHAAEYRPGQPSDRDHKLRNRLLLANVVAWIAILVAIRLIFF